MTDIKKTIKFAKKLKSDYAQFSILCPYPNTDLYRLCLQKGILKDDVWLNFSKNPSKDFSPPVWSEYFTRGELEKIAKKMYKEFYLMPNFIFNEISKIRSLKEVKVKIKAGLNLFRS